MSLEERAKKFLCHGGTGGSSTFEEMFTLISDQAAALKEAEERTWQPIETAPKDGSDFLVWCEFHGGKFPPIIIAGKFGDDGFYCQDGGELSFNWNPTHWMPLPKPPALSQKEST